MGKKRLRVMLLGVAACVPLVYLVVLLGYLLPTLSTLGHPGGNSESRYFTMFRVVVAASLVVFVLNFVLVAFFGWLLHKSSAVPRAKKSLWASLLLVGNIMVLPVFWYLFLWHAPAGREAEPTPV